MKKIMQYSREKFIEFGDEKKLRILVSFIEAIEKFWSDEEERNRLLQEFNRCLNYLADSSNPVFREIRRDFKTIMLIDRQTFTAAAIKYLRRFGTEPKDYDPVNIDQERKTGCRTVPLYAVLVDLRSAFNVGSIIRTSECLGIEKVFMCGYTPTPDNIKVRKTAMATDKRIAWERREDVLELMTELREKEGKEMIALETGAGSVPLDKSSVSQPAALLVGNEALGLPQKVLDNSDRIVSIPLAGWKESLNVSVAFGIACYEILRQWNIIDNQKEEE